MNKDENVNRYARSNREISFCREREGESKLPLGPSCRSHFDFAIVCSLEPVIWPVIHVMTH